MITTLTKTILSPNSATALHFQLAFSFALPYEDVH